MEAALVFGIQLVAMRIQATKIVSKMKQIVMSIVSNPLGRANVICLKSVGLAKANWKDGILIRNGTSASTLLMEVAWETPTIF